MGDMGDIFRDGAEIKGEQKRARATQAHQMIQDVRDKVDGLTVDASGTWNVVKGTTKAQFYPTKGTWQVGGKMLRGGIFGFMDWLDRN